MFRKFIFDTYLKMSKGKEALNFLALAQIRKKCLSGESNARKMAIKQRGS
jgi:hypothetical protein